MNFVIPFWLKIVGPIVLLAVVFGSLAAWGGHKYHAGYDSGVTATDKKWEEAAAKLKRDAAKSATKADDAAANRLSEQVNQITADQEKVDEAQRNGTSPLDALFN
jgi:hypothetical protein